MKQALNADARSFLKRARSRQAGLLSHKPKRGRARELTLVNSILKEGSIPTPAEQGYQEAVRPVAPHLEEGTSELPSGVGRGALVEVRW